MNFFVGPAPFFLKIEKQSTSVAKILIFCRILIFFQFSKKKVLGPPPPGTSPPEDDDSDDDDEVARSRKKLTKTININRNRRV